MDGNKIISFNLPSPYQAELAKIADQQRMAEMLQAQSQAPTERYSYKGIEARTPVTAGLAKALQGFGGAYFQGQAREQEKELGKQYQEDLMSTLERSGNLASGYQPAIGAPSDELGGGPTRPAQMMKPNPEAAARALMAHPATQPLGMQQLQKNAQMQAFINAGNLSNQPVSPVSPVSPAAPLADTSGSAPSMPPAENPSVPAPVAPAPQATTASALSRFGSPAGGQPMAVWLQTDPSGAKYIEQLAKDYTEQNKPTDKIKELRAAGVKEGSDAWNFALTDTATQGGIWRRAADGSISLAPGYAAGQGAVTSATEAAKAGENISTREVGGRNVTGTDRQFKILATGVAPTNEEAVAVLKWADRNGIKASIEGPNTQTPGTIKQPVSAQIPAQVGFGIRNPTPAEAAQEKEFATGGAAAITKKLDSSYDLAKNSVERITTINDLKSVVELPAFSGPGATSQLLLGQLANKFYGAANAETLANTTLKLQGLADLSLKAAGLIKGQGSITEPERALLAKAKSAPENLTVPEYKALFKVLEKQDSAIIKEHQDLVKRAEKSGVKNIDFWSVDVPTTATTSAPKLNLSPAAQAAVDRATKGGR